MEGIAVLVLIVLGTVGARNLPIDTRTVVPVAGLPLEFGDLVVSIYTKTSQAGVFPTRDLAENEVDVESIGLPLNTHIEDEEAEDDIHNNVLFNKENDDNESHEYVTNETDIIKDIKEEVDGKRDQLSPVGENVERQEKIKGKERLEDRVAITGNECPKGYVRVGETCWEEQ